MIESKRGCGFRTVGGIYLIGEGLGADCDRLPLALRPCPTCGESPRFHRSISQINARHLWGDHYECRDPFPCPVCTPTERAWLMWVGAFYTPKSFVAEAQRLGVSKRIAALPSDLHLDEDWVYLAYLHLIPPNGQPRFVLLDSEKNPRRGYEPGIFFAFRPVQVEKIVTETQARDHEAMEKLRQAGITPIAVPDDDPDHNPRKRGRKAEMAMEV